MLIYDGSIVHLRGGPEAVRLLLGNLKLDAVELQAPIDCEKEVLKKFPNYRQKATMILMSLEKGDENVSVSAKA